MYNYKKGNGNAHTQKTVNGVTHNYFYAGGKLMRQTDGTNTLDFFYDESGHPYALKYNGTTYYYVTNLQGDVLKIVYKDEDDAIQVAASYTYDPYGKVLSATGALAEINPLRYRGYVYDSETGFYYLQSRYYDPTICRFINADSYASTGQGFLGYNMFAYCNNNPANMADSAGNLSQWIGDIWEEIKDFFSPDSNSISGEFEDGIFFGSGSLTGGYSEANGRLQVNSKNSKNNGMLGVFGKISTGNASGKIGIGNHNASLSLKGVGDGLTSTIQAGIQYKDGAGLAAKAKASVLSGRVTFELNLFGWQAEVGVSGDLLSVGAEAMVGVFPNEGFTAKASAGAGLFGAGFVIRIKPPQ